MKPVSIGAYCAPTAARHGHADSIRGHASPTGIRRFGAVRGDRADLEPVRRERVSRPDDLRM